MSEESRRKIEVLRRQERAAAPAAAAPYSASSKWWEIYQKSLAKLPPQTQQVVEEDARYIADRAMPMIGSVLDREAYGEARVRTGVVVGSVQSGKTASMLAVAALILDRQVDVLIFLAGTRVPLWLQTYERLLSQLDGSSADVAWKRDKVRTLVPQPEDVLGSETRVDPIAYLRGQRRRAEKGLIERTPLIIVVPKEDDHLLALAKFVDELLGSSERTHDSEPISMVVLDDEADDASVLDAADSGKVTPKFIEMLWSRGPSKPLTTHKNVFATYIAYTATPQANFLQHAHNPLAPRDFFAALRVPSDIGTTSPRCVSYAEPGGLSGYYTGGDFYYDRFHGLAADPCIGYPFPETDDGDEHAGEGGVDAVISDFDATRWTMLGDALRHYFVSGAVRLLLSKKHFHKSGTVFPTLEAAVAELPSAHSMLYHPSALKNDHFAAAVAIVRWSRSSEGMLSLAEVHAQEFDEQRAYLDVSGLEARLESEADLWSVWLERFKASTAALATLPGGGPNAIHDLEWETVKACLCEQVFPNVNIRVLNSDARASSRPEFLPSKTDTGWEAPADIYSIFIAGNVLSRGLTVEGLCTSLFLRGAREPAADTQMQMQRWFGYRGAYFAMCRVFGFSDQLELFRQYHGTDQALKSEILSAMDAPIAGARDSILVLQGETFRATSKVETKRVPLHPGPTPSIRMFEPPDGDCYDANLAVLASTLDVPDLTALTTDGVLRGLIREIPLSLLEVASLLEKFTYSRHDPALSLEMSQRWTHLQQLMRISTPFFRPPGRAPGPMRVEPSGCPYSIAAYLRFWQAALDDPTVPGLRPTDNDKVPWNMTDIKAYRSAKPEFYVGVRFGPLQTAQSEQLRRFDLQMMTRGISERHPDQLVTLWGSRNPSEKWLGDQLFDYHLHGPEKAPHLLTGDKWRPRGHPGLLLFHVVKEPLGREVICMGLSIPQGGPDHIAALK
ncbi:Z1 domain-containing protein [Acidovorax sp. DW039]|uniref:Z1 domain-containing protein n=1 Tax=Acidovorax sp. DW039 TaxID=3095606 RepID=UPI00308D721C|nr:Z1 domain-containing protein [Acidovorax sp. DW039]